MDSGFLFGKFQQVKHVGKRTTQEERRSAAKYRELFLQSAARAHLGCAIQFADSAGWIVDCFDCRKKVECTRVANPSTGMQTLRSVSHREPFPTTLILKCMKTCSVFVGEAH